MNGRITNWLTFLWSLICILLNKKKGWGEAEVVVLTNADSEYVKLAQNILHRHLCRLTRFPICRVDQPVALLVLTKLQGNGGKKGLGRVERWERREVRDFVASFPQDIEGMRQLWEEVRTHGNVSPI